MRSDGLGHVRCRQEIVKDLAFFFDVSHNCLVPALVVLYMGVTQRA